MVRRMRPSLPLGASEGFAVIDQLVVAAPSPPEPAELIYVLNGPERLLAGRRMTFAALSASRPLAARAQS